MTIHIERLERLATLLDGYQPGPGQPAFNLDQWSTSQTKRVGFLWLQQVECGTAACAVGLACFSGIFREEGLRMICHMPVFEGETNWDAVEVFFGLSEKQAVRLFDEDSYEISRGPIAAVAVAARIRVLIARSKKARRLKPRTQAAVEKIKADALRKPERETV